MIKTPPPEPRGEPEDLTNDSRAYELPPELAETALADDAGGEPPPRSPRSAALKLAAVVAVVLVVGAGLLTYRVHHRRKVLAEGLSKADALMRLDTAAGYRQAASLLEPLAELDPQEAASVRALALAMLFADYHAAEVEGDVEKLLVAPGRAEVVPASAHLASAALSLGRREAGTATTAITRAGEGAWARALQARVALLAGNTAAALEPAAAAAAEGAFPPGLALHGDALRRLRKDPAGSRAAYEAALSASPFQPRAAYGLAKLALGGQAPPKEAFDALDRLLADRAGTPGPERARAALHVAALKIRGGDRAGAERALDDAGLEGRPRAWALRAATVEAEQRGPYRAVAGAPVELLSASDDDPPELSPEPPQPPAAVAKAAPKPHAKPVAKKGAVTKKKATVSKATVSKATVSKKTAAKKPSATSKKATAAKTASASKAKKKTKPKAAEKD